MTEVLTHSPDVSYVELDPAAQKVFDWRLEWLIRSYKRPNAERIAADPSIDWHFAVKLRENCADEKLCMRVLFGK